MLRRLRKKDDGAETAEWVVIVALLVVVAVVIYSTVLNGTLTNVVTGIETTVTNATG